MHQGRTPEHKVMQAAPGTAVVTLLGEHDLATSEAIDTELQALIAANDLVVVDVTETEFIDSSVISVLYKADRTARAQQRRFRLQVGTSPLVRRTLEISGILEQLECASTREEALR